MMKPILKRAISLMIIFILFGCAILTPETETGSLLSDDLRVTSDESDTEEGAATLLPPTLASSEIEQPIGVGPVVTPTLFPAVSTDTSRQLETFDAFWEIVAEEYVYPDYNGLDWDGIRPQYRNRVEAGMSNPEFWRMLTELVYMLDDEHSYFISTDEVEGVRTLRTTGVGYSGVGVSLIGRPEQGDALAAWVIPGNGLYEAGVRDGDRLIAVNGHPICCELNGDVFDFLIINSFLASDVRPLFDAAWNELNSPTRLDGVIIDLRTNTGGLITPTRNIMGYFYTGVWHYYYEPYVRDGRTINADGGGDDILGSKTVPMVVLVGEATNSMGEFFGGVMRDTGRATLIGRPTNGNIETLTPFDLPDGSQLVLATDSYVPLSLDEWESNGLTLDITVEQAYGEIARDGRDEALEAALELLR